MSPLEKCLFRSKCHFLIELFVFFYIEPHELFVFLEINPLLVASFANIFSHSEGFLFVSFMVSFAMKMSMKNNIYIYIYMYI